MPDSAVLVIVPATGENTISASVTVSFDLN